MGKHSIYLIDESEDALRDIQKHFGKLGVKLKTSQAIGSAVIFYKEHLEKV